MWKHVAIVLVVAGCGGGGDKCEKAIEKMAPLMNKKKDEVAAGEKKAPRPEEISAAVRNCKSDLAEHPEHAAWLDCIIATTGEITDDKMMKCEKAGSGAATETK